MANVNNPIGFRAEGQPIRIGEYRIASGYGTALFINDVVQLSSGVVVKADVVAPSKWVTATAYSLNDLVKPTSGNGRYYKCTTAGTSDTGEPTWPTSEGATVTDGTAVFTDMGYLNAILGSIVGFVSDHGADVDGYYPASSSNDYIALVADHPDEIFIAQDDGDGTAIALTDIGKTGNIISTTAGSITTNLSGMEADGSSFSGSGQLPTDMLKLVDILKYPENVVGANADWFFGVNNHVYRPVIA